MAIGPWGHNKSAVDQELQGLDNRNKAKIKPKADYDYYDDLRKAKVAARAAGVKNWAKWYEDYYRRNPKPMVSND